MHPGDIARSLLKKIIKDVGLSEDEFRKLFLTEEPAGWATCHRIPLTGPVCANELTRSPLGDRNNAIVTGGILQLSMKSALHALSCVQRQERTDDEICPIRSAAGEAG